MQPRFWDITRPLQAGMPLWPGSSFDLSSVKALDGGDAVNESHLSANVHCGTHIDAPLHFLADGSPVDELPLSALAGPATVAWLPGAGAVTRAALAALSLPATTKRLLLRTDNSLRLREAGTFDPNYVALTPDAASWVVERGIELAGVDYLSVERFGGDGEVHRVLLGAGVVVVEGLDLRDVEPGEYWLACLPLRLTGAEGAPARAVLMRPGPTEAAA